MRPFIQKHNFLIKALGFIFLVGVMFVLNEHQEASSKHNKAKASISVVHNDANMNSVATPIPLRTESGLPIKLIYNPNSDFLSVVNQNNERIELTNFMQWKRNYLQFGSKVNISYLIKILSTTHNKDIQ